MQDLVVTWMFRIDTWRAGGQSSSAYPPIVRREGVLVEFVPRSHPGAGRESAAKPSACNVLMPNLALQMPAS